MNIYLVERLDGLEARKAGELGIDYDEHDSFVCAAESVSTAREMSPGSWPVKDTRTLEVTCVGKAWVSKPHIILASFCAG